MWHYNLSSDRPFVSHHPPLNSGKTARVASKLFWTLLCCLVRSTKWVNSYSKQQTIRNGQPFRVHAIFLFLSPFLASYFFAFFVIFCVREQLVELVELGRKGEYWGKQRIASDSRCADEWREKHEINDVEGLSMCSCVQNWQSKEQERKCVLNNENIFSRTMRLIVWTFSRIEHWMAAAWKRKMLVYCFSSLIFSEAWCESRGGDGMKMYENERRKNTHRLCFLLGTSIHTGVKTRNEIHSWMN